MLLILADWILNPKLRLLSQQLRLLLTCGAFVTMWTVLNSSQDEPISSVSPDLSIFPRKAIRKPSYLRRSSSSSASSRACTLSIFRLCASTIDISPIRRLQHRTTSPSLPLRPASTLIRGQLRPVPTRCHCLRSRHTRYASPSRHIRAGTANRACSRCPSSPSHSTVSAKVLRASSPSIRCACW